MTQVTPIVRPENRLRLLKAPKSLLVIEDDLSMVEYINAILDELRQGLEWDYVTSGEAALDLIHRRSYFRGDAPYSLVITDIFLEGEASGLDVWLDCQEKYKTMPFAVTSSLSHDRYSSILRGVNNCPVYLPKPLSVDRFASLFREYL